MSSVVGVDTPFYLSNFLSTDPLTLVDIQTILDETDLMKRAVRGHSVDHVLENKILATLFFEPSTRTRLSFESAMMRLGGQVISVENGMSSSVGKGESLEDMGRVVSEYSDVIVVRHYEPHSANALAAYATVPVINAGDGDRLHPTQALLDIYTMVSEKGSLDGLTIGLVGDLKYSRTIHSLINVVKRWDVRFVFVSQSELGLPETVLRELTENGTSFEVVDSLDAVVSCLDVLYMTRLQRERQTEALAVRHIISADMMRSAKEDLLILHPLPRVGEILPEVDHLPQAGYFKQAQNGLYLRMALLKLILCEGR